MIGRKSRLYKLSAIAMTSWIALLSACASYHGPTGDSIDPRVLRENLLSTLEALEIGDDIFLELSSGERHRGSYQSHDTDKVTVRARGLNASEVSLYALKDIVHVEQVDISAAKTAGAVIGGIVVLWGVLLVASEPSFFGL